MFRTVIFWSHLCSGVVAGLIVLIMSVTGIILTYERQILDWENRDYFVEPGMAEPTAGQAALPLESLPIEMLVKSVEEQAGFSPDSITFDNDPAAPAVARQGRSESRYLNPYTGEVYPARESSLDSFFSTVTGIHRWLGVSGDGRDTARQVTGVSNLIFLFLIVSGLYLWLPKIYRWAAFKMRVWFVKSPNSAARDFNWHHVMGIWAAIPLLVIVGSGAVFNYEWANNLVYRLVGEQPPERGRRGAPGGEEAQEQYARQVPFDVIIKNAGAQVESWQTLTINLPAGSDEQVTVNIDQGTGGQPQKRHNVLLDAESGDLVEWQPFSSLPAGRQARSWVRFLHTGEAFGIVGQTIAGLSSLAAVFMVWTGLALAWRRWMRSRAKAQRQTRQAEVSA